MNIQNLTPTVAQVNAWCRQNDILRIGIDTLITRIDESLSTCEAIITLPDFETITISAANDFDRFIEILKMPTSFGHAWEMMRQGAIFECKDQPGEYTVIDNCLFTMFEVAWLESKWVEWKLTSSHGVAEWIFTGDFREEK